ncbi:MAG: dehydrogenase [Anaerolineaceae bacterium]|nr:dehydrogenase [Anaerolineaceae bacterium]
MRPFHLAITGDFLNEQGTSAYGDLGFGAMESCPFIDIHYIMEHAPRANDPSYWDNLYSMEVKAEHLKGMDGLIVLRPYIRAHAYAGAENLTVIGRSGAGYDKIDVPACTANDVLLFNLPNTLNHSTASTALMFILALTKNLMAQDRVTRAGRWDLQAEVLGTEIERKTLGIIGLGASGRELARIIAPFNMRILAYSPHAEPEQAAALGVELTSLETLMRKSDVVSIHASLTPDKYHMIKAEHLAMMKPKAFFVNVARGALVDQAALVKALQERKIAGAGLDVFEVEPLPADDPLTKLDNVLLTPHWAPATSDIWTAGGLLMAQCMLDAAQGKIPPNVINKSVLDSAKFQAKLARFVENQAVQL